MARASVTPFIDTRDHRLSDARSTRPHTAPTPTSSIFPFLRRLEIGNDNAMSGSQHNPSLLTLRLSSTSFLDSTVLDDLNERSIYTIKTNGASTTVSRADLWEGPSDTAEIKWNGRTPAKTKSKDSTESISLQMHGSRWKTANEFLKSGSILSSRKFHIPHYPRSLKWKRVGTAYHLTTYSVKGPVAIFEPAIASIPPQIHIFETFRDKHNMREAQHAGVSMVLLDYVLVTCLLLGTETHEWLTLMRLNLRNTEPEADIPLPTPSSMHNRQWRKIVYGEPQYPSLRSSSPTSSLGDRASWDNTSLSSDSYLPTPSTTRSAPSRPYAQRDVPPVPQLPSQYQSQSPRLSSHASSPSLNRRRLPSPPVAQPNLDWIARSQSTPPAPPISPSLSTVSSYFPPSASDLSEVLPRPPHSRAASTSSTSNRRMLPQPPQAPRRPGTAVSEKRRSLYPRSLPGTPVGLPSPHMEPEAVPIQRRLRDLSLDKESSELGAWIMQQPTTSSRAVFDSDAPPPAYHAIFSQSRAQAPVSLS